MARNYLLGQRAKQAELTAALETATKASEELKQAQSKQLDALKAIEKARADEEAARKSGDTAALKKAQEEARRAEEEAKKQGELVKQRETAAAAGQEGAGCRSRRKQSATSRPDRNQAGSRRGPETRSRSRSRAGPGHQGAGARDQGTRAEQGRRAAETQVAIRARA